MGCHRPRAQRGKPCSAVLGALLISPPFGGLRSDQCSSPRIFPTNRKSLACQEIPPCRVVWLSALRHLHCTGTPDGGPTDQLCVRAVRAQDSCASCAGHRHFCARTHTRELLQSSQLPPSPSVLPPTTILDFANRSNRKWRTGATEKINDESKWFLLYWMHKPHENPGSVFGSGTQEAPNLTQALAREPPLSPSCARTPHKNSSLSSTSSLHSPALRMLLPVP